MAVQTSLLSVRNSVLAHCKILYLAWYHKRTWKLMPLARNTPVLPRWSSEALVLKRIKNCEKGQSVGTVAVSCFIIQLVPSYTLFLSFLLIQSCSGLVVMLSQVIWLQKRKRNRNSVEWLLGCFSRASWSLLAGGFPLQPGGSCRQARLGRGADQMLRLCW